MAMGLAAVIALPGPPTRRPGRLGRESLFRTGAGLFWPGLSPTRLATAGKRCADYIRDSPDFLRGDDHRRSGHFKAPHPEGRELPEGVHPISLRASQKLSGHLA